MVDEVSAANTLRRTVETMINPQLRLIGDASMDRAFGSDGHQASQMKQHNTTEDHKLAAKPPLTSERQWRDVFEHSPVMHFMVDVTGTVLLVSTSGASQLGYAVRELVGRSVLNFVPEEDDKELVRRSVAECLERPGQSNSWEVRKIRKDGRILWTRENAKAIRWSGSELVVLIASEDITERYLGELESSRLAAIVSSSDDAIVSKTVDGTITSWNAGAANIFGYEAHEMIGQPIFRIIPADLHEEEKQILLRLQRGERIRHYETTRIAKDGHRVDISLTVSPLFNKSGKVVGASKVARDITEPKSAEKALRESASQLRTLIETAVDGVILIDARGVVLIFNPACEKLFGYAADEVIGQNVKMLMPRQYRHEHDRYIANYRETREAKIIGVGREVVGHRKDGSTFPINLSVGEARQDGEPIFVGIIHDLTKRKQTETELARVARLTTLGELTAAIAHEVNQPLTGLVSSGHACLRWLASETPDVEAARHSVERMIRAGNRAGEVISRIRALVGKSPPQRDRININDTVNEVIALIGGEVQRNRISLQTKLSNEVPLVLGDRIQLQQVILNLMLNAIEAMSEGSQLRRELSVASTKDMSNGVLVTVGDSGPGLDKTALERIFEAFYSTKARGMGIGLAVSRTIIRSHGGQIWASPNVPQGAEFQFSLPAEGEEVS